MVVNGSSIKLTISIVYYDTNYDVLNETLSSIRDAIEFARQKLLLTSISIVIINNGLSKMKLIGLLKNLLDPDRYIWDVIESGGNIGYGAGHNLAILNYASDYHLIINPDVLVDRRALYAAIRYMEVNKQVGMLTPYSESILGRKQNLCKYYPTVFRLFLRGFMPDSIRKIFEKRLRSYEVELKDDTSCILGQGVMVSGCFMFTRYSVLNKIRGFSPEYFVYFEDFDLSIRINQLSKIAYAHDVRIVHRGGFASRKGRAHVQLFAKSAFVFFKKYGWQWL